MAPHVGGPKKNSSLQLQDLQNNTQFWHKIRVFLFDLRHFSERIDSRNRLELIIDPSYIGAPYFEPSEAQRLHSFVPEGQGLTLKELVDSTLVERLNRRMKKRAASADYRVCAAHDLAPVFEKAFGVKPKDLQKDKKFVKAVTAGGLSLEKS
ncbi:MAG: hypothetical protein Q9219_007104 [cf. Caloplaca sp. 3 TL-2023]